MNDDRAQRLPAVMGDVNPFEPLTRPKRLSIWTSAGQIDRQQEAEHVLRIQQLRRQAIEAMTREAAATADDIARLDRRARVLTEKKYILHRANKESQILGEDPILAAKFAILDDDEFARMRLNGQE